jgi:hypothetical protein
MFGYDNDGRATNDRIVTAPVFGSGGAGVRFRSDRLRFHAAYVGGDKDGESKGELAGAAFAVFGATDCYPSHRERKNEIKDCSSSFVRFVRFASLEFDSISPDRPTDRSPSYLEPRRFDLPFLVSLGTTRFVRQGGGRSSSPRGTTHKRHKRGGTSMFCGERVPTKI